MNKQEQKQSREHGKQIPFTDDLMFSLTSAAGFTSQTWTSTAWRKDKIIGS